jgi:hypothetical protein
MQKITPFLWYSNEAVRPILAVRCFEMRCSKRTLAGGVAYKRRKLACVKNDFDSPSAYQASP